MVDLINYNEFNEFIPDLWFNDGKEVSVKLKCAKILDIQKEVRTQIGVTPDKIAEMNHEFIKKHVGEINGLSVGGTPVTSFDDLRENGPNELYSWISSVIYSTQQLSQAEVKN
jgi:hypothetical protein